MHLSPSPTRFGHAGKLAAMGFLPEANSANAEEPDVTGIAPAQRATIISLHLEPRLSFLFLN